MEPANAAATRATLTTVDDQPSRRGEADSARTASVRFGETRLGNIASIQLPQEVAGTREPQRGERQRWTFVWPDSWRMEVAGWSEHSEFWAAPLAELDQLAPAQTAAVHP